MPKYKIQHRIRTLSENAVGVAEGNPQFTAEGIQFTHWEFNPSVGWLYDAWLAEFEVEASEAKFAIYEFKKKLYKVIPRISLIGQAYIQYLVQPQLTIKVDSGVAHLYCPIDVGPVSLMFETNEKKALDKLLENDNVPEEFYLYWNDAVNTTGYSSKLLIMFSAIDALIKQPNDTKDFALRTKILGKPLKDKIYAQGTGLRHRLVHGEYFSENDTDNFMEVVHKKVIKYFNDVVLKEKLITEDITGPQRHFTDNDELLQCFIQQNDTEWPLELKKVIEDVENNKNGNLPVHYKLVHDDSVTKGF